MKTTNRKSSQYVFTADVNSATDMKRIQHVRDQVKQDNIGSDTKMRVCLRGRKPQVKQELYNMWTEESVIRSYDWSGNIVGGLANATKIDVYIYERS
jgi:hypothetical protein